MPNTKLIDVEIIENDLLKSISEKYLINYDDLLNELHNIPSFRNVYSKYSCDHYFFSRDNEKSFYWAGFLAADGCVYSKSSYSKVLSLSLAQKDLPHLEVFKTNLNYTGTIRSAITRHSLTNPNWNDSIKNNICISSTQIFNDLKRFGIVPAKTKILEFPNWLIEHPLVNHFMRGYNDGDGSFFHDKSRDRICFELRGTASFLNTYKQIIESNVNFKNKTNITTPDSTSKLKYYGKKMMPHIVDFLYKNATIFLQRKYDIAKLAKDKINLHT